MYKVTVIETVDELFECLSNATGCSDGKVTRLPSICGNIKLRIVGKPLETKNDYELISVGVDAEDAKIKIAASVNAVDVLKEALRRAGLTDCSIMLSI